MTRGAVKTGQAAGRRDLRFESMEDVLADVGKILCAPHVATLGNWSPGQAMQHVGRLIRFSLDGFPFQAPLWMRLIGPLLKPLAMRDKPMPAGFPLRGATRALEPDPSVPLEEGAEELRTHATRVINGERMEARSPVFGRMSHEDWVRLHLRHAALHLSFLLPESPEQERPGA